MTDPESAMRIGLIILLVCAAADLVACAVLFVVVGFEHRRVRREAAAAGNPIPSARGQLGCLFVFALIGLALVYGTAWFLFRE